MIRSRVQAARRAVLPATLAQIAAVALALGANSARADSAGAHAPAETPAGVSNMQRAWQNWTLNCQGCHVDGTGSAATAPRLAGTVAKFVSIPGGREYLERVPGVATSPLSNADLAEVMNWMLWRFDKAHLPAEYRPFTAAEIGQLRTQPLRLEAAPLRAALLRKTESPGTP